MRLNKAIRQMKNGEVARRMDRLCDANKSVIHSMLQNAVKETAETTIALGQVIAYAEKLGREEVDHHLQDEI